jgi:predicted ATPase
MAYDAPAKKSPVKKIVLTGGPCTGKTTMLRELENRGFRTMPEIARALIQEQLDAGGNILPWINMSAFQEEALKRMIMLEKTSAPGITFFDRGIPDIVAYCNAFDLPASALAKEKLAQCDYEMVFILDRLAYRQDKERKETDEEAQRIHQSIIAIYEQSPYPVIHVPVMPIAERIRFLLSHVKDAPLQ